MNENGDLYISNNSDDGDIIFRSDNGSGGLAEYFRLNGGFSSPYTNFPDNSTLSIGGSNDLRIFHDGTNTSINNLTGNLQIGQYADDSDIIFYCDDGSGGVTAYITLDGSAGHITVQKEMQFEDSVFARFGTGSDFKIYHNGSTTFLENNTGDIQITNYADDKDIIFKSDDGSGGVETYFFLDGSASGGNPYTVFPDNSLLAFGSGNDFIINHNGSNTNLGNYTGDLEIVNYANDKDIVFKSDDGSGGTEVYFRLDGSLSSGNPVTVFPDQARLQLGTDADLWIYSDGNNSYLYNNNGDLKIQQAKADKDLILLCDDGSGGETAYITLDGSAGYTTVQKKILFEDSVVAGFGNSTDLYISYNGSYGSIMNENGDLYISNNSDDGDIIFRSDNGSGGLAEYFRLNGGFSSPYTNFPDNSTLSFGGSNDLRIFHDGTNTSINNLTGNLLIGQYADDSDIIFQSDDGSGGVETYFFLDGSASSGNPYTVFPDNSLLAFGSGNDFIINHNGTNTNLGNYTGDLEIVNYANDKDIVFKSDDGSGGTEVYFRLDGSLSSGNPFTIFPDSSILGLGSGADVQFYHDGSNMTMINTTGSMAFYQSVDDGDMVFYCDDGSGGLTEYFRLDGGTEKNIFTKPVQVGVDDTGHDVIFYGATSGRYLQWDESANKLLLRDNVKGVFGNASDLQIFHDASNSYIYHGGTGNLYIKNETDDQDVVLQCDDGSGGVTAYITLDGSETEIHIHKPVGMGTTNPDTAYKLDVAGKVQVQDVLELDDVLTLNAISTPADPAAGKSSIYMDSADGAIKVKINVGGTVVTRTIASYE
jgi:hypothetical protein